PQKTWQQNSLVYSNDALIFRREAILKRVIPGVDGRIQIFNTAEWPYSIHAHLNMRLNGDEYGGSGSMVGPHHLLTCAHCVYDYDKQKFFDTIAAYPALNGECAPFSKANVTKAYIF